MEHGFGTRSSTGWGDTAKLAILKQIHSDKILVADQPGLQGEGDALITNRPGIALAIRTADCLPILMADARNRAIAAVHAGWRGTVQEISSKTLERMKQEFGTRPEDVAIAIGPGIGPCCFEVDADVAIQFLPFFPERGDLSQRTKVDLVETNLRQLRRNGGRTRQIATSGLCSCCGGNRFESYRRDREAAGRMVSTIRIL